MATAVLDDDLAIRALAGFGPQHRCQGRAVEFDPSGFFEIEQVDEGWQ